MMQLGCITMKVLDFAISHKYKFLWVITETEFKGITLQM